MRRPEGDDAQAWLIRRQSAVANNRKEYDRALELDPTNDIACGNQAQQLIEQGRTEEALASATRATELNPNHGKHWIRHGHVLRGLGRLDEALTSFHKAATLQPSDSVALSHLGDMYLALGHHQHALTTYERSIALDPSNVPDALAYNIDSASAWTWIGLGIALQHLQREAEAVEAFSRAARLNPAAKPGPRSKESLAGFERRILAVDMMDSRDPGEAGAAKFQEGRFEEALADFEVDIALGNPNAEQAVHTCQVILNRLANNPQLDRRAVTAALKQTELGVFAAGIGRWPEAVVLHLEALKLDPESVDALINLAVALAQVGKQQDALGAYYKALQLDPSNPVGWMNLGGLLRALGRTDEALVACDRALQVNPRDPKAMVNKANALGDHKRFEESLLLYDQAIAIDASIPQAWRMKAMTLNSLDRFEEALAAWRKLEELGEEDAVERIAIALLTLDRNAEALEVAERDVNQSAVGSPRFAWAMLVRGWALERLDRKDEALHCFFTARYLGVDKVEARLTELRQLGVDVEGHYERWKKANGNLR